MINSSVLLSDVRLHARRLVGQIITTLLVEGYAPDIAYRIAFNQAETWATAQRTTYESSISYHVTPHPSGWVVRQPNLTIPCLVFTTQAEAIQIGRDLAQIDHSTLIIHQENGEIEHHLPDR